MSKRRLAIPILVLVFVLQVAAVSSACTSMLVTPGASADGSASVTHTCDCGSCAYEVVKVAARDWEPGTMRDVLILPQYTGGLQVHQVAANPSGNQIPQVEHTYAYLRSLFGLMNEKQVGIGETTFGGRRESRNPDGFFDITNLSMLALERGATAQEAIQVMGDLAVKYGYKDGGEELSVSDPNECWVFEIVGPGPLWAQGSEDPGAYWVAQRVPDGHVAASANDAVIATIDWDDTENFMYGPGVKEYAIDQGWYDPASGEEFSWRKHFCNATAFDTCGRRVWRVLSLAAPSLADTLDETNLPFSVPVDKKLSIADIAAIKRDHYEGTEFYGGDSVTAGPWNNPRRYRGLGFKVGDDRYSWNRMIAQVQCEYVIITQSRAWLPDAIGGVVWYGAANPDATCFVPLYNSMAEVSETMNTKAGSHMEFTRDSYWWAISAVSTYADLKYSYMIKDINTMIDKYEGKAMNVQSGMDATALKLYEQDPALAIDFLTKYCNDNVEEVRDAWWGLLDHLMWKYNAGFLNEGGRIKTISYPEDWLKRVVELGEPDHYKK